MKNRTQIDFIKRVANLATRFYDDIGTCEGEDVFVQLRDKENEDGYDHTEDLDNNGIKDKEVFFWTNQITGFHNEPDFIKLVSSGEIEIDLYSEYWEYFDEDGVPERNPDHISKSGSKYWIEENKEIRLSDHWAQLKTSDNIDFAINMNDYVAGFREI